MSPDSRKPPAGGDRGLSNVDQLGGDRAESNLKPRHNQLARYPDGPGHKGPSDTGQAAAEAFAHKAKPIRVRTLEVIERAPATAEQVAAEIDVHWMLTRARCSELRAKGLIEDSGQRGDGALGGRVVVWRATTPLERAIFSARKAAEAEHGEAA